MARDEAKIAQAVAALKAHWQGGGDVNTAPSDQAPHDMRQAFAQDPQRFSRYSLRLDDLLLDWSKCRVNDTTMSLLKNLAEACGVESRRNAMFAGEAINTTEGRSVLHIALRAKPDAVIVAEGENVMPLVSDVLQRMSAFCDAIRAGTMRGATGKVITDVVNIGIGGSDLGPVMATLALTPYHDGPRTHFVSNIDPAHISDTLAGLDPQTTLIIIASKTFTTIETMTNAQTARRWISEALGEQAVGAHFVAVSTALEKVAAFGIAPERVFGFWDWVGGRYSIWSSIGLPLMLAIGKEDFRQFLDGAQAMDNHFRSATLDQNLPMMLGLIGYWHRAICDYSSRAIIPYDQHLARLPAYLQQLDMESNGKSVKVDGAPVDGPTGPVVWGEPGTNGQHAFFQLLHQGSDVIPVELMIAAKTHQPELLLQHQMLLANCFAQSEAFMKGRTLSEAQAQLRAQNLPESEVERIAPHRVFSGNRPTITLAYELLTPFALGRLIALYEHRVFVEAQLFGINAFDQWGVELGKELATQLLSVVTGETSSSDRDSSTQGLVAYLHAANGAE